MIKTKTKIYILNKCTCDNDADANTDDSYIGIVSIMNIFIIIIIIHPSIHFIYPSIHLEGCGGAGANLIGDYLLKVSGSQKP